MGRVFEYTTPLLSYKQAVVSAFTRIIADLAGIHHIQRYVMERLFWPDPVLVGSVSGEEEWCRTLKLTIEESVDMATEPLNKYLEEFESNQEFLNVDVDEYLGGLTHSKNDDDDEEEPEEDNDNNEGEEKDEDGNVIPKAKLVKVNLESLRDVLSKHVKERDAISEAIPDRAVELGLFEVNVLAMRKMLSDKHSEIIGKLLVAHQGHSETMTSFLMKSFNRVLKRLRVVPTNVEETSELEEVSEEGRAKRAPQNVF